MKSGVGGIGKLGESVSWWRQGVGTSVESTSRCQSHGVCGHMQLMPHPVCVIPLNAIAFVSFGISPSNFNHVLSHDGLGLVGNLVTLTLIWCDSL